MLKAMVHLRSVAVALLAIPAALQVASAGSTQTSTALTVSKNPSVLGNAVSLTAAITPSSATGKVTFYDGATILGVQTIATGHAVTTTILLPSGTRSLNAFYSGDATFASSTSAVYSQTVTVVPSYEFQPLLQFAQGYASTRGLAVGDFNGDNKADVAFGTLSSLNIFLGNGDGTFSPGPSYAVGPIEIKAGDFNGDGRTDLLAVSSGSGVNVLLGNGDGTFVLGPLLTTGRYHAVVGDFNGDGKADFAALADATPEPVLIFLGNGDGTFAAPLSGPTTSDVGDSAVVDVDGDRIADLVLHESGGSLSVYLGNGDGTFRWKSTYAGRDEGPMAVGDFNKDGKPDIVLSSLVDNGSSSAVRILTNNGDGSFTAGPSYPLYFVSNGYYAIGVGDFDGDGNLDAIVSGQDNSSGAGIFGVLLGNGDGTLAPVSSSPSPQDMMYTAVGEFNGDGRTDVAYVDLFSAGLNILLGAPLPIGQTPTITTLVSSANPSFAGDAVTFTASVFPSAAPGTIEFRDGSSVIGTVTLNAQGIATLTTPPLPSPGSHTLSIAYSGAPAYLPSTTRFIQSVAVLYAPRSPAAGLTTNFLVNPGAERMMQNWTGGGANTTLAAHAGASSFVATQSPAFISQTLSLLQQGVSGAQIDAGQVTLNFSYWYLNAGAGPGARFQISVTFYNRFNEAIAQGRSIMRTGESVWTNDAGSFPIPWRSTSVVYTMNIFDGQGTGLIDENLLTVSHESYTDNLLTNPGGESSNLAPGWVPFPGSPLPAVVSGTSYFGAGAANAAYAGTYVFYGGPREDSYISQTVDLSKSLGRITFAQIDAGAYIVNYSFWYAYRNAGPASLGRITLTYYDTNHKKIAQSLANQVTAPSWTNEVGYFPLPPLSRYIVYTMDFNGPASLLDTGVFDENFLTIGSGSLN